MAEETFTFADMLSRRQDFTGDLREVGASARGKILDIHMIGGQSDNWRVQMLITDYTGKQKSILTVIAFFDPDCDGADTIIIPELKMSFQYRWHSPRFSTMNLLYAINVLNYQKGDDPDMSEFQAITAAAAVCAVYERFGRTYCEDICCDH